MKTYISEDAFLLWDWKENKMKNSNEEIEILLFSVKVSISLLVVTKNEGQSSAEKWSDKIEFIPIIDNWQNFTDGKESRRMFVLFLIIVLNFFYGKYQNCFSIVNNIDTSLYTLSAWRSKVRSGWVILSRNVIYWIRTRLDVMKIWYFICISGFGQAIRKTENDYLDLNFKTGCYANLMLHLCTIFGLNLQTSQLGHPFPFLLDLNWDGVWI